jgi:hypothetical protein
LRAERGKQERGDCGAMDITSLSLSQRQCNRLFDLFRRDGIFGWRGHTQE